MNRLHQLKQTLIKNIEDNSSYNNIEFVVLDYNSQDGMEDWIRNNVLDYINSGKVIYYKTTQPQTWSPSHSKNLAFNLATGDIICNIWSDYFAGKNFSDFVNKKFCDNPNIVMTPIDFHKTSMDYAPPPDVLGKVCVRKSDFIKINGFDERMDRHGFEDYDFVNRLELTGIKRVLIEDQAYLGFIPHDDSERYKLPKLESLFLNYIDPSTSDYILLFIDGRFQKETIVDNFYVNASNYLNSFSTEKSLYRYRIAESVEFGQWSKTYEGIHLSYQNNANDNLILNQGENQIHTSQATNKVYCKLNNEEIINNLLKFRHFYQTRSIMEANLLEKNVVPNMGEFGKGLVYKNFQAEPIRI